MAGQVRVTTREDNSSRVKSGIKAAIQNGLSQIGMKAEGYAKDLCPVDTGLLRNSITHVVSEDKAYIGTNVEYGPYVENGTSKQRAKPFLRPAAQNHGSEYREILRNALKNG